MLNAFLLTRQWRDTRDGIILDFWWATEHGPRWTQINKQEVVFFILSENALRAKVLLKPLHAYRIAKVDLKTFNNNPVHAVYFKSHRTSRDAQELLQRNGITFWEADIRPHERYLMERFITAGAVIDTAETPVPFVDIKKPLLNPRLAPAEYRPELKVVSFDIETSMDAGELFSIAIWAKNERKVFMAGLPSTDELVQDADVEFVKYCDSQSSCIQEFLRWFADYDPDIIIGWSVVQFDLWVLESLCKKL
jgi:DNA polymerase-2